MKISTLLAIITLALISFSCERCIQCEIYGNPISDSLFNDRDTIVYPEFCGTPSEVEAFEGDVQHNADARQCVVYSIIRASDQVTLATYAHCGGIQQLETFTQFLNDSILNSVYLDQEVFLLLDTTIQNPGTYKCVEK